MKYPDIAVELNLLTMTPSSSSYTKSRKGKGISRSTFHYILYLVIAALWIRSALNAMSFLKHQYGYAEVDDLADNAPRILVVFAGPTVGIDSTIDLNQPTISQVKQLKYHLNMEYFLRHGVQCKSQDTLFVLSSSTLHLYRNRIRDLDRECQQNNHRVLVTTRENKCLDLEAVRVAVYGAMVNVSTYDYFFYVNCGVSGPAKEVANLPWTALFLAKLQGQVKMTGLSHACPYPHIQSMMYALDREGLQIVMKGGAIFDCQQRWPDFDKQDSDVAHGLIVNNYERKMGDLILQAGYGIEAYLRSELILDHNQSRCQTKDMWLGAHLKEAYAGRIPLLNETIFFKSTRYLTPDLAEEIGYDAKIIGNWV